MRVRAHRLDIGLTGQVGGVSEGDVAGPAERGQAQPDPAHRQVRISQAHRHGEADSTLAAVRLSSVRKFSADPLLAAQATPMTEDQRSHPVIAALHRRRDQGSKPGARTDSRRIALVIEGGAMRGVVSAGMTAATRAAWLHRLLRRGPRRVRGRVRSRLPARRSGRLSDRLISVRVRQPVLRRRRQPPAQAAGVRPGVRRQ